MCNLKDHTYLSFVSPSLFLFLSKGSLHCVRKRTRFDQDSLLGAFLGLQKLSWKALDPPKTFKNQWFDVRFAFDLPSLCFCIAFALPSLFLFLVQDVCLPLSFSFRPYGSSSCGLPSGSPYGASNPGLPSDSPYGLPDLAFLLALPMGFSVVAFLLALPMGLSVLAFLLAVPMELPVLLPSGTLPIPTLTMRI